jgi:isocitrate dehydrogenase kinase/phosphatase
MPESHSDDDEYGDEAWFGVGARDVFPSEFGRFLSLPGGLTAAFHERHPQISDLAFWTEVQGRVKSGDIIDIFPYPANRRLH